LEIIGVDPQLSLAKSLIMYLFYSIGLLIALLLAGPYFFYQAYRHQKYWGSLAARLGYGKPLSPAPPRLLVHCVSVGEFLAAEPLLEQLRAQLPQYALTISTTTATGQALARQRAGQFADIVYFPLDFPFAVRRFLARTQPIAIIIIETELWPNFLRIAAQQQRPVIIANGRISPRSFRRYQWIKFWLPTVLANVTRFLMQTAEDAQRITALGARAETVQATGNIKYDLGSPTQLARLDTIATQLAPLLQLPRSQPVLVVGSTTAGEEALILAAYQQLCTNPTLANTLLILAPRHPERFEEVAQLLQQQQLTFVRRTHLAPPLEANVTERSTTNIAERSTANVAERSTANVAEHSTANVAERSTANVAERSTANVAERSTANTAASNSFQHTTTEKSPSKSPSTSNPAVSDPVAKDLPQRAKAVNEVATAKVILCDTIGELAAIYRYADVVFVGGSLLPHGGHNILEPALYGRAIVTGAYTANFSKILADFRAAQAVVELPPLENQALSTALANCWQQLLLEPTTRQTLGTNAYQVMQDNRGAVTRHLAAIIATLATAQLAPQLTSSSEPRQ
jgi:3-deoxy-D-manno-octulosonic-acid transferase